MPETPLSPEQRLEAILYQYVNLYERWSEDRQAFAQKGAELSKLSASVHAEVERLADVEQRVQQSLKKELVAVVSTAKAQIVGVATDQAKEELWRAAQQLNRVVTETEQTLQQSFWEVAKSRWQWFGITLAGGALSGFLFSFCFLPLHLHPLSETQLTWMSSGRAFDENFSDLSHADQDKVMRLLSKGDKSEQHEPRAP
ncbi:MAG: hypothetical protein GY776_02190 [Alteromonas sp.]|nr:hypothetical protein [Alteromonas sp.]